MRRLPKFVKLICATAMMLGVYSGVAYGGDGTPPKITTHPESQRNVVGANVEFNVTATGENLKYQWQYKPNIKGGSWTNSTDSGATTNKLKLVANDQNKYLYRCLISDDTYSGDKAIMSNAATLYVLDGQIFEVKYMADIPSAPVIVTQPLSQMLTVGEKATFTVNATGSDLTYQWQYKSSLPNAAWTNLTKSDGTGFDTNTFTTTALTGSQDHYQYRCLVRSNNYYYDDENAKESDSAVLEVSPKGYIDMQYINEEYDIVEHPVSQGTYVGNSVKFKVDTTGSTKLTYRWLYKAPGTNTSWTEVPDTMAQGTQTAEMTISPVKEEYDNYQFRCSVGGEYYKYDEAKLSSIATLLLLSETQTVDLHLDTSKFMITEWNVSGDAGLEITLPVQGTGLNITVDWGDGTDIETVTTAFPTHIYANAGVYEIAVSGNCPEWGYASSTTITTMDKYYTYAQYLTKVKQFGELNATRYGFANCQNLTTVSGEKLVTEKTFESVLSFQHMFCNCTSLTNLELSLSNAKKITDLSFMFENCVNLTNINISGLDTSNVTNMRSMFKRCNKIINLDLSKFNTANVQNMNAMFADCSSLQKLDLSNFNTSKVIAFGSMFSNCSSLKELDVSKFDTHSAKDMPWMFASTGVVTLDLKNFDTSNVTNMSAMFRGCKATSIDVSSFDTSKVTNMEEMFSMSEVKSLDLSNFNTSNVTNMKNMFYSCKATKVDLSNFDTSKVTDMTGMFNWSFIETLDISSFDLSSIKVTTDADGTILTGLEKFTTGRSTMKSILIGEKFIVPEGAKNVFNTAISAIITTSSTPVANQFKGLLPENTKLYVPNGSEESYKITLSGDTDAIKIKPIIEPVGDMSIKIIQGSEYMDDGCTVAGFTGTDSKYYTCYGYEVSSTDNVNTSEKGKYKVTYTLRKNGTNTSNAERNVEVLGMPKTPTNFKASEMTSIDKINLTWENGDTSETVKFKLKYLDETGTWKKLSDNATSPYIHTGLTSGKTYEYRLCAVSEDNVSSKYVYAIGKTAIDDISIIIRNDNILPIIEFIEMTPASDYIASNNTIKIKFKAEDINYKYEESNISADDIIVKVGGIVNNDVIKTISKVKTTNGEEYELELKNITGVGKLLIIIPKGKIVDKAGNKNVEATLDIPTFVANGGISDTKPTVTVDENEITIINNQTSIAKIVKIEYQYRISGDTEYTTIPNGESGDTATSNILKDALADTYYEIRTVTHDSTGNKQESKVATVKTASLDSNLISIVATPTTFTSGDVKITITYTTKFNKEYSTDGTNYIRLTNANTKELDIKANTIIYARLTDGQNYSDVVTYEVNNIDKDKPIIGNVAVSPNGKSNSKQIVATDVKDIGVSGLKGYYISKVANLENPTWTKINGDGFTYTIKENGTYYVWVSDNVGNISEAQIVIATGIVDGVSNIVCDKEIEISVGETAKLEIAYSGEAMSETYTSSNTAIVKVEKNIRQIEGISKGTANVEIVIKDYDGTEHKVVIKVTVKPAELQAKLMSDGIDYNGEWTNKDVNAILTTNGVKPAEYKEKNTSNGAWTKPENVETDNITGLTTITYSGDYSGDKYYIGMNADGNTITTEAGAFTIKLDKTAPTMGVAKKTAGTNSIDVAIIGATDNLSGIKEYEIGIYKDNVCLGTYKGASGEATFIQLSSSTTYQLKYKITDNAGNETDMIDGGSETTGIIRRVVTYDYKTNGGTSATLESEERIAGTMIDLTVTAVKSGYNFKGWAKTPSGDILTSMVMPEEDVTLYAIFKDEDAPKVEDKSYETVDGELDIILKPSDDGSGIGGYAVTTDDGTPTKWEMKEPDATGYVRITVPGTNKYYVWVKDLEGNFIRYEQIAIKDIFAPTGTIEVKENVVKGLPYANRNEVNLRITAEDNESKPEDIKIAIYNEEEYKNIKSYTAINFAYKYVDGGLETKHTTTPGDGLKRIYVIFKDKAGNISMTIKQLP